MEESYFATSNAARANKDHYLDLARIESKAEVQRLEEEIQDKDVQIRELNEELRRLKNSIGIIEDSVGWKITKKCEKLIDRFFPIGSYRSAR